MRLFATGAINWVMGKALPDDVPIEAKMVSKAIERAQTTVEQKNGEIRKNVLKYDEVMNEQRKVIYALRDQILDGADLRERILDRAPAGGRRARSSTRTASADYHEEWDLDGLHTEMLTFWPSTLTAERARPRSTAPTSSTSSSSTRPSRTTSGARASSAPSVMRQVERQVMLRIIDQRWREHLYEMDYLQEGINLRAMGQKDPLTEWQREGFEMFGQMMQGIAQDLVRYVMHVQVSCPSSQAPATPRRRRPTPSPGRRATSAAGRPHGVEDDDADAGVRDHAVLAPEDPAAGGRHEPACEPTGPRPAQPARPAAASAPATGPTAPATMTPGREDRLGQDRRATPRARAGAARSTSSATATQPEARCGTSPTSWSRRCKRARRRRAVPEGRRAAGPPPAARDRGVAARPVGRRRRGPPGHRRAGRRDATTSSATSGSIGAARGRRDARTSWPARSTTRRQEAEIEAALAGLDRELRGLELRSHVLRRARRARRPVHDPGRRGRRRRPGLGRDALPHVRALGRAPRLRGGGGGVHRRLRGRLSLGRVRRQGPLRLRLPAGRAGRPPPGAHEPVQRPGQAPDRVRRARRSCRCSTRATARSRSTSKDIKMDVFRSSGAGGQHINKTRRRSASPTCPTGHRRVLPDRALASSRTGPRPWRCSRPSWPSSERAGARGRARRASGASSSGWASAARSAATCCSRTRWSRTSGPSTRPATSQGVLDGDLDPFMEAYLQWRRATPTVLRRSSDHSPRPYAPTSRTARAPDRRAVEWRSGQPRSTTHKRLGRADAQRARQAVAAGAVSRRARPRPLGRRRASARPPTVARRPAALTLAAASSAARAAPATGRAAASPVSTPSGAPPGEVVGRTSSSVARSPGGRVQRSPE